jgi:hypothetical protein
VARAFEPGGPLAVLGGRAHGVDRATVWTEEHGHRPGTLLRRSQGEALVAAADGYALLRLVPAPSARRRAARALARPLRRR